MLCASELANEEGLEPLLFDMKDRESSERLRQAMLRVYALEGGRELIESAQEEALLRLDRYERERHQRFIPNTAKKLD